MELSTPINPSTERRTQNHSTWASSPSQIINDKYILRFLHKLLSPQIKFDIHDKYTDKLLDRELAFDVEVKDINDNPPQFVAPVMIFDVNENSPEGEFAAL